MRLFSFMFVIMIFVIAACGAPQPEIPAPVALPTQTELPPTATPLPPAETVAPQGKLPAAPFDAQVYINEEAGFALDYPTGWTVNETVVGSRVELRSSSYHNLTWRKPRPSRKARPDFRRSFTSGIQKTTWPPMYST